MISVFPAHQSSAGTAAGDRSSPCQEHSRAGRACVTSVRDVPHSSDAPPGQKMRASPWARGALEGLGTHCLPPWGAHQADLSAAASPGVARSGRLSGHPAERGCNEPGSREGTPLESSVTDRRACAHYAAARKWVTSDVTAHMRRQHHGTQGSQLAATAGEIANEGEEAICT